MIKINKIKWEFFLMRKLCMKKKKILVITCLIIICLLPFLSVFSDEQKFYDGSNVQITDNEFGKPESIRAKDRHAGWKLGDFVVSDYSDWVTDKSGEDVFLKKKGDKITITFNLQQDIKKLNGNKNYQILDIKRGDMIQPVLDDGVNGLGTLFVEKEDYNGKKSSVKKYANYLKAISLNANTKVLALEEGDYHFVLVYAIDDTSLFSDFFNKHQYYRLDYRFKVRNGNAMAFIKDAETGKELNNNSTTKGFIIDTAQSYYLNIQVVKKDKNDEIRKNIPYKNGEVISEEGDYVISVTTDYSNEPTQKQIHVIGNGINHTSEDRIVSSNAGAEKIKTKKDGKQQGSRRRIILILLISGIILVCFLTLKIRSRKEGGVHEDL